MTDTTWIAWGSGRVPVGVDETQTDFKTVELTGGSNSVTLTTANLPSHTHSVPNHTHTMASAGSHNHSIYAVKTGTSGSSQYRVGSSGSADTSFGCSSEGAHTHTINSSGSCTTGSVGSGTAIDITPTYITCYMWKRTA